MFKRTGSQQGQALIFGLFVLFGGLAALFYLFNTGQLVREKTKLVNTSDAVVYSAGIMHARTLNFDAYANRAMMANTVAIAQLVSLSSWVQYVDNMGRYGIGLNNPKFDWFYPSYYAAQTSGKFLYWTLIDTSALQNLAEGSDKIIRKILMNAQQVAYEGLVPARKDVMDQVASANYNNDGTVTVEVMSLSGGDFKDFVSLYKDSDRTRFAEVVKTAAYGDKFLPKRSWSLPGLWSDCPGATASGRVDWLDRRGGTEMIGFDQWQAIDTLSEKRWVPRNYIDVLCLAISEVPTGWGLQADADSPSLDLDPTHYDNSLIVNPAATALAIASSSSSWGYSGLPNFYDLSDAALTAANDDPRLVLAIRLRRDISQTVTSEGRSAILSSSRINAYKAAPAGGSELVAVSASEVYFERPDLQDVKCPDGATEGHDNCYGRIEKSRGREIGSLFNPYWQLRLIQSDDGIKKAREMQGVTQR